MKKSLILLVTLFLFTSTPVLAKIGQNELDSVVRVELYTHTDQGTYEAVFIGSGVAIDNYGSILTNYHVLEPAILYPDEYLVLICGEFHDQDEVEGAVCSESGEILYYDAERDLALFEVTKLLMFTFDRRDIFMEVEFTTDKSTRTIPHTTIAKDKPNFGDEISVLGYPDAGGDTVTFTKGIVSGFQGYYIKTDAKVNAGNSGGGAFNENNELVGIPTAYSGGEGNIGWLVSNTAIHQFLNDAGYSGIEEQIGTSSIFPDVPNTHKNKLAIEQLKKANVLNGYPDNTFRPANPVNRAELIKILVESQLDYFNPDFYDNDCFRDTPKGSWFTPYVCYAEFRGWVQGYSDHLFKPEQTVSKAEAVKIIFNAFRLSVPERASQKYFTDVALIDWFAPYVQVAKEQGLLEETSGNFYPHQGMTRAGVSEIIYRTLLYEGLL